MKKVFVIEGNPLPKAVMTYKGKWSKVAKRTLDYQKHVSYQYRASGVKHFEGDISVRAKFYRDSKRKCDVDNLIKALFDGLQYEKVAFNNDSQIKEVYGRIRYDKNNPRTEVSIKDLT